MGKVVEIAPGYIFTFRRENGEPHPETFSKTIDKPLNLFVIKNPQFFKHEGMIQENCPIIHIFCKLIHVLG
jgi:hypothetical protein